ncbi:MAG: hypothetical protein KAS64_03290 [Spirochaetes bacterium]|nr:hypothetical protein [Spirochaetota bacterium]
MQEIKWVLPHYAQRFKDKLPQERESLYNDIGLRSATIKDKIFRKLFQFLCEIIESQYLKTKRAIITYDYFFDTVLKWASNPNNLRSAPWFPHGEETLRNNLNPLLDLLEEKKLCYIGKILRNKTVVKTIALLEGAGKDSPQLEKIKSILNNKFKNVISNRHYPLTTIKEIQQEIKGEISESIYIESIPLKEFGRKRLHNILNQEKDRSELVNIDFGNNYLVLFTTEQLKQIYGIMSLRIIEFFKQLIANPSVGSNGMMMQKLNKFLSEKFVSQSITVQSMFEKLKDEKGEEFSNYLGQWVALIYRLSHEVSYNQSKGSEQVTLKQTINLVYSYLMNEYDNKRESQAVETLVTNIKEHIKRYKRYVTKDEVDNMTESLNYKNTFGEDAYEEAHRKFIKECVHQSEEKENEFAEIQIIRFTGKVVGEYYIHMEHILGLYIENLEKAKDKDSGIIKRRYIDHWGDMLYTDSYDSKVELLMKNDKALYEDICEHLEEDYPMAHNIYVYFLKYPGLLNVLCSKYNVARENFFFKKGDEVTIKTIFALLGYSRVQIIKKVRNDISFWRKLLLKLSKLFGRSGGSGNSLWNTVSFENSSIMDSSSKHRESHKPVPVSKSPKAVQKKKKQIKKHAKTHASSKSRPSQPAKIDPRKFKELHSNYANGMSKDELAAQWNTKIGEAAKQNRANIDGVIYTRIKSIIKRLKQDSIPSEVNNITNDLRFSKVGNKKYLTRYIGVIVLEEFKKAQDPRNRK